MQAALASTAETRDLFEATLAALERLDGKKRGLEDEIAGEEYVAALLKDPRTPAPVLQQALRMLRPDHPSLTLDRLKRFLDHESEAVRIEAVRSLCQSPRRGRFEILARLADDPRASLAIRAEAIAGLAEDAAGNRERLLALASGSNSRCCGMKLCAACEASRSPKIRDRGFARSSSGDAEGLELVDFMLKLGSAGSIAARSSWGFGATTSTAGWPSSSGPADAAAGERVFFHTKGPGCYRCHQVQGRGSRAGPDLTTLSAGIDRRRLIESIVAPSKEIAPQFVAYSVARNDGTVFSGILLEAVSGGRPGLRRFARPEDSGQERRYRRAEAAGDLDHA